MVFISVTRLKIRSFRLAPAFSLHTLRTLQQVRKAEGFEHGMLLADWNWTFWTMTAWDTRENMLRYMTSGAHQAAMPHLLDWCDEASVVHWSQPQRDLPSWIEADARMRKDGRASKVRHPSAAHATLAYRAPRTTASGIIRRS